MKANQPALPQTRAFEKAMLRVYQTQTISQLGHAVVELIYALIPVRCSAVFLRPLGFKESLIFSRPEHLTMYQAWVREAPRVDIWLKRSPPVPGQRVVRNTDHTPDRIFARSKMCRRMKEFNLRYGAAVQVWDRQELIGLVLLARSKAQGDFSNADMRLLGRVYPYIATAVRRVFALQKDRQERASLEEATAVAESGIIVLDSELRVLQSNPSAFEVCDRWAGISSRPLKKPVLRIPGEILDACRKLSQRHNVHTGKNGGEMVVCHPKRLSLRCTIRRIAVKEPALDHGDFLLRFSDSSDVAPMAKQASPAALLTVRERELTEIIARGKTNLQAATELKKSLATVRNQLHTIFHKLGIQRRCELATLWARRSSN